MCAVPLLGCSGAGLLFKLFWVVLFGVLFWVLFWVAVLVAALSGVPRAVDVLLSCGYCDGAGCQICRRAALLRAACEIWARNDHYSQSRNCIFVTRYPHPGSRVWPLKTRFLAQSFCDRFLVSRFFAAERSLGKRLGSAHLTCK